MTIKIVWGQLGFPLYHVYTADQYLVESLRDDNGAATGNMRLLIDSDKHDILLSGKDRAYVMNDRGSTIDVICP